MDPEAQVRIGILIFIGSKFTFLKFTFTGKDWDVVVINEKSTYPAYKDSTVCRKMYPYAEKFTEYIRKYNPDAKIQWYMTWGWKNGNDKWCEKYDWFCTYEDMQERIRETYLYVFKSALN